MTTRLNKDKGRSVWNYLYHMSLIIMFEGQEEDLEAVRHLLEKEEAKLTAWEVAFLRTMLEILEDEDALALSTARRSKIDELWQDVVVDRRRG